jgi:hypothetical protein
MVERTNQAGIAVRKVGNDVAQTTLEAQRQDPGYQEQVKFQEERGKTGSPALNKGIGDLKTLVQKAKTDKRYMAVAGGNDAQKVEALSDILGGDLEQWGKFNKYKKMSQLIAHFTNQLMANEEIKGFYDPDEVKQMVQAVMEGKRVPLAGGPKPAVQTETRGGISGIQQVP